MKIRFIVILLSILSMSTMSFAGVPTVDILGTPQAFIETVQTVASKIENSKQVLTMQETMSKIGSARSSVSDFINKQKDVANEYKEKMDEYIARGEDYMAKFEAYKEESLKYIGQTEEDKDMEEGEGEGEGNEPDQNDELPKQDENITEEKDVENTDIPAYSSEVRTGNVAVNGVRSMVGGEDKSVDKFNDMTDRTRMGYNYSPVSVSTGDEKIVLDQSINKGSKDNGAGKISDKMVKHPVITTTRKAGGFSTKAQGEAMLKEAAPEAKKATLERAIEGDASKIKQAGSTGTALKRADAQVSKAGGTQKAQGGAMLKEAAPEAKKATLERAIEGGASKIKQAGSTGTALKKADAQVSKAEGAQKAQGRATLKEAAPEAKKATLERAIEGGASKIKQAGSTDLKSSVKNTKIKDMESKPLTTKRKQFKSSFGYGKIQNKHQLLFASAKEGIKTGDTPEGVMILPESISMYCNLNYETAIEDKNMENCLRNINTISTSEVTEEISKQQIDDTTKDFLNGYAELLATTYFEALEMYNDSLTFKNNMIDPVITTTRNDIDASWAIAKEMHLVLGNRINNLRKLWSRVTNLKMYEQFRNEKFTKENQ